MMILLKCYFNFKNADLLDISIENTKITHQFKFVKYLFIFIRFNIKSSVVKLTGKTN